MGIIHARKERKQPTYAFRAVQWYKPSGMSQRVATTHRQETTAYGSEGKQTGWEFSVKYPVLCGMRTNSGVGVQEGVKLRAAAQRDTAVNAQ